MKKQLIFLLTGTLLFSLPVYGAEQIEKEPVRVKSEEMELPKDSAETEGEAVEEDEEVRQWKELVKKASEDTTKEFPGWNIPKPGKK